MRYIHILERKRERERDQETLVRESHWLYASCTYSTGYQACNSRLVPQLESNCNLLVHRSMLLNHWNTAAGLFYFFFKSMRVRVRSRRASRSTRHSINVFPFEHFCITLIEVIVNQVTWLPHMDLPSSDPITLDTPG